MRFSRRKLLLSSAFLLTVLSCAFLWHVCSSDEPSYGGKRLSVWVDELRTLDPSKRLDPNTPQVQALRAIGTNAIPWLLSELGRGENPLEWRINMLLEKQRFTKYRFPDADKHGSRAAFGFYALGPLAKPAIPGLLNLLETRPSVVPFALAGIGTAGLPALQQCLTNTRSYAFTTGPQAIIPGETIGCIYNAVNAGRISEREAAIFLPSIRDWAKSTNTHAVAYATQFLTDFHQSLSSNKEIDEPPKARE